MRAYAHRILLLALFGVWVLVAWPPLSRQFTNLELRRGQLGDRTVAQRAAILDYPAFGVAQQVKRVTPSGACILFLAYTGPEHVNYYKTRFDYYLYPRRIRILADSGAVAENCEYVAVFRDSDANLAEEPFRGHWNEDQLQHRLTGLEKIHSGRHIDIYKSAGGRRS